MKVLIVDDSKIARLNIRSQLDDNLSVLEAATFEEGLLKIRNFKFDICYIDLRLDNSSKLRGLELVEEAVKKDFIPLS
jgi:CheY-like chemotaxis protein